MNLRYHHKLQLSQLVLHSLCVYGLLIFWNPWLLLLVPIGYFLFGIVGNELGSHRYFSHRSFKTTRVKENILIILSIYAMNGSTLSWCANHRTHHKYADRNGDPHPASDSWRTWFWIGTEDKNLMSVTVVKDLLKNPLHLFVRKNYFIIYYITLGLIALLNIQTALYMFVVPAVLIMHLTSDTNVFGHKTGYRNFDTPDNSRNSILRNTVRLCSGVGWHNNHHAMPGSYTTKVKSHEYDLVGWLIEKFFMIKE